MIFISILSISLFVGSGLAAMCGESEYFEFKFKPVSAGPIKGEDAEDAHGRCGTIENRCDLMFMVYGEDHCNEGSGAGNGKAMRGPRDKNIVQGNEFDPHRLDWTVHADWNLGQAFEIPFTVRLCDHDHFLEGSNDNLLKWEEQHLKEGCHPFTVRDVKEEPEHPWEMKFEICCRPIAEAGFFRNNGIDHK